MTATRTASAPSDHRDLLHGRGRRDESGVDVDAGRQPGLGGHLQVGEDPADLGLLLRGQDPGGAGYADEVRTRGAGVGPGVQHAAGAGGDGRARRHRGHRVAEGDDDHVLVGAHEQPVLAGIHARRWAGSRPPIRRSAGRVAIAEQGMEMSSARGAPDTSGAVTWLTCPSALCLAATGWSPWSVAPEATGTRRTTADPTIPATTATNRGIRCDRSITVVGHEGRS